MRVGIIIPAYNEAAAIASTVREYKEVFPHARVAVVNNNSTDTTADEARKALNPETDLLLFERRQGKGYAVKTGLSRLDADVYVITDGDATYPAEEAKRLLDILVAGRHDMTVGDRVSNGAYAAQNTRAGHNLGNKLLTAVISLLAQEHYTDVLSGLRIMSRPLVEQLDIRSSGFQIETELNVLAAYLRSDIVEVPIDYRARGRDSESKLNTLRDGIRILSFALNNWIAFSPLQPFTVVAAAALPISALLGWRVITGFLETGHPYSTTATAAVATGIVGILAIFFGTTLRILSRNERRREIARFLEAKRTWNATLDTGSRKHRK